LGRSHRDGRFPGLFDAVLADAGIEVVLSGVRMPRMNAVRERWVRTCRRELLDPITDPDQIAGLDIRNANVWAESSTSTNMPLDLHG
jgi:transposase InsO family protein